MSGEAEETAQELEDEKTLELENLLTELHAILTREAVLDSINIIQASENLILECGHLALSIQAMKQLTCHIYNGLFPTGTPSLSEQQLDKYSAVAILLNPDDYQFWNVRKRLIKRTTVTMATLKSEIWVSSHALKLKPKSNEPFIHCKWLLKNNIPLVTEQIISNQLMLCGETAMNYKNNYYSWCHRLWILQNFRSLVNMTKEMFWSKCWMEQHVSDFSGMHYRFNFLLFKMKTSSTDEETASGTSQTVKKEQLKEIMVSEIRLVCDLIKFYSDNESLWSYLRTLFLYCESRKFDYFKRCKEHILAIDKIRNRYAIRFRENLIVGNFFGISI